MKLLLAILLDSRARWQEAEVTSRKTRRMKPERMAGTTSRLLATVRRRVRESALTWSIRAPVGEEIADLTTMRPGSSRRAKPKKLLAEVVAKDVVEEVAVKAVAMAVEAAADEALPLEAMATLELMSSERFGDPELLIATGPATTRVVCRS